jgi:hypothetical protein
MDEKAQQDAVQALVTRTFAELGATGPVIRTILLKDGYFAGDKFRCEGLWAANLAGQDTIEFYGEKLLKTVRLAS